MWLALQTTRTCREGTMREFLRRASVPTARSIEHHRRPKHLSSMGARKPGWRSVWLTGFRAHEPATAHAPRRERAGDDASLRLSNRNEAKSLPMLEPTQVTRCFTCSASVKSFISSFRFRWIWTNTFRPANVSGLRRCETSRRPMTGCRLLRSYHNTRQEHKSRTQA